MSHCTREEVAVSCSNMLGIAALGWPRPTLQLLPNCAYTVRARYTDVSLTGPRQGAGCTYCTYVQPAPCMHICTISVRTVRTYVQICTTGVYVCVQIVLQYMHVHDKTTLNGDTSESNSLVLSTIDLNTFHPALNSSLSLGSVDTSMNDLRPDDQEKLPQ